ncbi:hypothetical protein D3C78_1010250 [compost metagenome]
MQLLLTVGDQGRIVAFTLFDGRGHLAQESIQRWRDGTLFFVQITVARRQRQAIFGTHGRFANDLDRHVQIAHQGADHRQLLEVFLTEDGQIRLDHVEQLADHCRHTFEMAWTAGATQAFGQLRNVDAGLAVHTVGVHLFDAGGEQQVAPGLEQFLLVGSEGSRVLVEVFAGAELQRVDEDTRNDEIDALCGLGHQGGVAAVQVAHGRYETDAFAFTACPRHGGAQFADGLDCIHALNPCSLPGKLTSLTAVT